jgi:chromosome segregation ATPase
MLMVVMTPREEWTDERLDDLNKKVDDGFARLDADIRELRNEMNEGFRAVNARFDAVNRNMLAGFLMVIATIIGSNAF